jgi:hypothetical protein
MVDDFEDGCLLGCTQCSLVDIDRRFGGAYRLHHPDGDLPDYTVLHPEDKHFNTRHHDDMKSHHWWHCSCLMARKLKMILFLVVDCWNGRYSLWPLRFVIFNLVVYDDCDGLYMVMIIVDGCCDDWQQICIMVDMVTTIFSNMVLNGGLFWLWWLST